MKVWNKYANTAARVHGRPGCEVRPSSVTIDIHSHVAVPNAAEFVKPHLDLSLMPLTQFASADTRELNQQQEAEVRSRMTQHDRRLADLDRMGVDMQVVMPSPRQCYHTLPIEIAVPAAQMINDWIAEFVSRMPDRFIGLGTVPMQGGEEAAKELERTIKKLGFRGVEILTNVAGKELSDPTFSPFWSKAEELGALVVVHPNGFTEGQRLSRYSFNNIIGNPLETTIALHYLIFDGVIERHPNLKILAVHGGGYLGAYPGRIDHAWGARSDSRGNLSQLPTTYLQKIYFDSVVFTSNQLEALVKAFGIDKIVMGTDYPFDMLEFDPIGHVVSVDSFDASMRAAIVGENAKRLLFG